MPIVSIIIVTYNSQKHISQCIHSILKQDLDLELIIVDNNSSDNTRAILKTIINKIEDVEKSSVIKLIYNSQNVGYGKAVNIGAAHANSPYILVLNPDVIIPEGELKKLLNFVENYDAKKFIIAPLSYTEKWSPRWSSFGSFPTYLKIFVDFTVMKLYVPEFLRKILYSGKINKMYKSREFIKVDWVSGGAFLIPKNFFEELHGFDERFFLLTVKASEQTRFKRVSSRGREDDTSSLKAFQEKDRRELSWGLGEAMKLADHTIINEGTLEEFHQQAKEILKKIVEG